MKRMHQLKPEMDASTRSQERCRAEEPGDTRSLQEEQDQPLGGVSPFWSSFRSLGLYYVLANAVQLRKEPFGLWIKDLSRRTPCACCRVPVNVMPLIMAGRCCAQKIILRSTSGEHGLHHADLMTFCSIRRRRAGIYWTISTDDGAAAGLDEPRPEGRIARCRGETPSGRAAGEGTR